MNEVVAVVRPQNAPIASTVHPQNAPIAVTVGRQGPPGAPGTGGLPSFHYVRPADDPLSVWAINHDKNAICVPILRDVDGNLMIAYFTQDLNTVLVSFPSPQSGTADLIF